MVEALETVLVMIFYFLLLGWCVFMLFVGAMLLIWKMRS